LVVEKWILYTSKWCHFEFCFVHLCPCGSDCHFFLLSIAIFRHIGWWHRKVLGQLVDLWHHGLSCLCMKWMTTISNLFLSGGNALVETPLHGNKCCISIQSGVFGINLQVYGTFAFSSTAHLAFEFESWDSDSIPVVVDNSANTHIWTRLDDFVPGTVVYFDDNADVGVLTIDDSTSRPVAQGLVIIQVTDNLSDVCELRLEKALYFPTSPVNILGVTQLAAQFNDPVGTWIQTRWKDSTLTWDHSQHTIDFDHPPGNLPVLHVNVGFKNHAAFCATFATDTIFHPSALRSSRTALSEDLHNSVLMVDDPARLDPAEKERFAEIMVDSDVFKVGDTVQLIGNGMHEKVEILSVDVATDTMVPYYKVSLPDGHSNLVTKDFLAPLDDQDLGVLPITTEQVKAQIRTLTPEEVDALLCPPSNVDGLDELFAWHYRLGHVSFMDMLKLS
jgi:hypothetical protein